MEQMNHLEAAILAAGVTCVYNADDWGRIADSAANDGENTSSGESSVQH
jgi:hypothetical protein